MQFTSDEEFQEYAQSTGRTYVSLEIGSTHGATKLGTILLELYNDIAPKTCDNFVRLVKGQGEGGHKYAGSPIHRIVKHGYVQGGDVVDGSGKGDPGFKIADETFAMKHDAEGVLAMANNGEPHTGASQFYMALGPLPWLDGRRVVFGKVLTEEGLATLRKVSELSTVYERPSPPVVILACTVVVEAAP